MAVDRTRALFAAVAMVGVLCAGWFAFRGEEFLSGSCPDVSLEEMDHLLNVITDPLEVGEIARLDLCDREESTASVTVRVYDGTDLKRVEVSIVSKLGAESVSRRDGCYQLERNLFVSIATERLSTGPKPEDGLTFLLGSDQDTVCEGFADQASTASPTE